MPSADSSPGIRATLASLSHFPWLATSQGAWEASRGKLSSLPCLGAGCIQHAPIVDGGLCGRVPARPERTTPHIRFVFLAPHLRSTLPSDASSRRRPCASLVLRLHVHLDRRLSLPSMTACTAHTPGLSRTGEQYSATCTADEPALPGVGCRPMFGTVWALHNALTGVEQPFHS
jgi:hypothetical protein